VSEVIELLAPLFDAGSLTYGMTLEETAEPLAARADREKVHQILLNLLGNAVKFTPPGGHVAVRVRPDRAGRLAIEVEDDGIGIPAEKLEWVFQPFVQLASLGPAPRQGIGLGLSISRTLARGMEGDLTAAAAPGGGSILTLTLPRD
jgi:signal transduction histidine kinase